MAPDKITEAPHAAIAILPIAVTAPETLATISPSPQVAAASSSLPSATSSAQDFHLFPELPLEIRRMVWNFALPNHFIPLRTVELCSVTKTPIAATKAVERVKTSVCLLTSSDELLDSVKELADSFQEDDHVVDLEKLAALEEGGSGKGTEADDAGQQDEKEKALNELLEKRFFRRTYDDLSLTNWDTLTSITISRLAASSQHASASYKRYLSAQSYRNGLHLVCREAHAELSRGMQPTLSRVFSADAVVFSDIHKSVTRMTGVPGAGRASLQNRSDFFFPSSSDPSLTSKPTAYFARDLEAKKGRLLAPGINFYPGKSTILYQGTLNAFFQDCLSCPTPNTGPNVNRTPAYSTTYANIRHLAVEQDPRDLLSSSYVPRNYGAHLDGLETLIFILERERVERVGDGLDWADGESALRGLEESTREMVEGWGFGVPRRCRVVVAREFWGM